MGGAGFASSASKWCICFCCKMLQSPRMLDLVSVTSLRELETAWVVENQLKPTLDSVQKMLGEHLHSSTIAPGEVSSDSRHCAHCSLREGKTSQSCKELFPLVTQLRNDAARCLPCSKKSQGSGRWDSCTLSSYSFCIQEKLRSYTGKSRAAPSFVSPGVSPGVTLCLVSFLAAL